MRDTRIEIGSVTLANPLMTASGTAGLSTELAAYMDLSALGAVVTKSLAPYEWKGNPAPRVHPTAQGMINAVGLQGPGVATWLQRDLPALIDTGATVVASIWGRSVADYHEAAVLMASAPPQVVAVEINLSCPNLEGRESIFAHDLELAVEVMAATEVCGRPRWAKLSANTHQIVEIAAAVNDAGAEAVTLINTMLAMVIDHTTLRPVLGNGGGGLSGRAIHPIAVRAVHDVHRALPKLPIIGVGGVASGWDAAEMLLAGATAVQVGTATFADPAAPMAVLRELLKWADEHKFARFADLSALA